MAHSHRLIDRHQIDDHPDATFGLIIGTLAVLTAVLVFSIYARAGDASQRASSPILHSVSQHR